MREQGTIIERRYYSNKYGNAEWWLLLTVREKRKIFKITGTSNIIPSEGDYIIAFGNYDDQSRFKATRIIIKEPREKDYIIDRLKSFDILEEDVIRKLVKAHGEKIWDLIDRKDPVIPQIEDVNRTFQFWKRRSDHEEAEIEVAKYFESIELPLENNEPLMLVRALGTGALDRIKNEPLCICQLLTTKIVERYIQKLKITGKIKKEMKFIADLHEQLNVGRDLCFPREEFDESYDDVIQALLNKKYLFIYKDFVYLLPPPGSFATDPEFDEEQDFYLREAKSFYQIESESALVISKLLNNTKEIKYDHLDEIIQANNLTEEQAAGLEMFMKNRISLIFGGPGKGKTKMIKAIVDLAYAIGKTFNLIAPTGRAAKQINEVLKEKSYTIHRWLLNKEIERGNFIIIDESSMIGAALFNAVLNNGGFERIIMLGDTDQLPPIPAGYPFLQLRRCEAVPRTILTKNFRFDENSVGIENALRKIIVGNTNLRNCGPGFQIINSNKARSKLKREIENYEEFDVNVFRVITPLRRLVNSEMNTIRNQFINFEEDEEYVIGDWVICRKNLSKLNVYNGDIGIIKDIRMCTVEKEYTKDGEIMKIEKEELHYFMDFEGNEVEINSIKDFSLAYITTVHSSQGSETNDIILIMETDSMINTRQLLYTAVSRARKNVIIIAPIEVISSMIARKEATRYSCLCEMINSLYKEEKTPEILDKNFLIEN